MPRRYKGYIPPELIDAIRSNKCVLFIGAGLSVKVERSNRKNLPSWSGLLEEMLTYGKIKRVNFWGNPNDIQEMITKGNLLMAAQELQDTLSKHEFGDFLNQVFRDIKVKPTSTHLLLPKIPFRCILTSNYDSLIEGAYALHSGGSIPMKFTQEDLLNISSPLRKDDFYIFKVHGDIERPNTIVLGSRDYQKLFYRAPEYRQFLETIFSVYTVLFIGFGGSDPDLDNILEKLSTVFSRTIDKHYILLPEKKFNTTEKKSLLIDKRLEVIEYEPENNHCQVDDFIQDLCNIFIDEEEQIKKKKRKKYDVFISYSHEDNQIANRIRGYLIERNYRIWYDKDINPGEVWAEVIADAIVSSRVMIVLITPNSSNSKWVYRELSIGILRQLDEKITLIPVVIGDVDNSELPSDLASIQFLRLKKDFGFRELAMLFEIIDKLREEENHG